MRIHDNTTSKIRIHVYVSTWGVIILVQSFKCTKKKNFIEKIFFSIVSILTIYNNIQTI